MTAHPRSGTFADRPSDLSVIWQHKTILTGVPIQMPYPNACFAVEQGLGQDIVRSFLRSILLYSQKNQATVFGQVGSLIDTARELELLFDVPEGLSYPSISRSSTEAVFQAASWNAKAAIYMGFISHVCDDSNSTDPAFVMYAGKGIGALIRSIEVFHNFLDDPILPNIASIVYM